MKISQLKPGMLVSMKRGGRYPYRMLIVRPNPPKKTRRGKKNFWGKGVWSVTFFDMVDGGNYGPCVMAPGNDTKFRLVAKRGSKVHQTACNEIINSQAELIASAESNCDLLREYRDRK